jgi:hypothetical protein
MCNGETYYQLSQRCGKDTSTFRDVIENPGNTEVRSLVQCVIIHRARIRIIIEIPETGDGNEIQKTWS